MKTKLIIFGIIGLVLIVGISIFFLNTPANAPSPNNELRNSSKLSETSGSSEADVKPTLTLKEVTLHSSKSDCWTIINGQVYDITDYVSRHPGGSEIIRACGFDATELFEKRTTESGEKVGSGTPHSNNAQKQLEQFKLGPLEN